MLHGFRGYVDNVAGSFGGRKVFHELVHRNRPLSTAVESLKELNDRRVVELHLHFEGGQEGTRMLADNSDVATSSIASFLSCSS